MNDVSPDLFLDAVFAYQRVRACNSRSSRSVSGV